MTKGRLENRNRQDKEKDSVTEICKKLGRSKTNNSLQISLEKDDKKRIEHRFPRTRRRKAHVRDNSDQPKDTLNEATLRQMDAKSRWRKNSI